jgi:hypothetical protein
MHTNSPYENRSTNNGLIDFNTPELQQALMMQAAPHMMMVPGMVPGMMPGMMPTGVMQGIMPGMTMHPMQLQNQSITPSQILAAQAGQSIPTTQQPYNNMMPQPGINAPVGMMHAYPQQPSSTVVGPPAFVDVNGTRYLPPAVEITESDVNGRVKDQTRQLLQKRLHGKGTDVKSQLAELNQNMQRSIGAY